MGISQGGWVVPYAASRDFRVAFVIVLSASGVSPDRQNAFAVRNDLNTRLSAVLEQSNVPSREIDAVLARHARTEESLEESSSSSAMEIVPGFSHFDPTIAWKGVHVPVLGMWGGLDRIVPAVESKRIIEDALRAGRNQDVTLEFLPGGDHELRLVPPAHDRWDWPRAVPGSREALTNWLTHQGLGHN